MQRHEALAARRRDRVVDRHADLGPPSPLHRVTPQQLVQVGVGRCVRGLSSDAEESRRGGEGDEARGLRGVAPPQMRHAVRLRAKHGRAACLGDILHRLVVNGARAVHDQLCIGERLDRRPLAHIAQPQLRAARQQSVDQGAIGGARRRAADKHETTCS